MRLGILVNRVIIPIQRYVNKRNDELLLFSDIRITKKSLNNGVASDPYTIH